LKQRFKLNKTKKPLQTSTKKKKIMVHKNKTYKILNLIKESCIYSSIKFSTGKLIVFSVLGQWNLKGAKFLFFLYIKYF